MFKLPVGVSVGFPSLEALTIEGVAGAAGISAVVGIDGLTNYNNEG